MFASARCSPQVASGTATRSKTFPLGVSWRTLAPSAFEQRAEYAFGNSAQGVFGRGSPLTAAFAAPPMTLSAKGFVGSR